MFCMIRSDKDLPPNCFGNVISQLTGTPDRYISPRDFDDMTTLETNRKNAQIEVQRRASTGETVHAAILRPKYREERLSAEGGSDIVITFNKKAEKGPDPSGEFVTEFRRLA